MSGWLLEPTYWSWWLLGLVLIILEMLLPGTFMLWLGMAALGVELVVLLFPALDWLVAIKGFSHPPKLYRSEHTLQTIMR